MRPWTPAIHPFGFQSLILGTTNTARMTAATAPITRNSGVLSLESSVEPPSGVTLPPSDTVKVLVGRTFSPVADRSFASTVYFPGASSMEIESELSVLCWPFTNHCTESCWSVVTTLSFTIAPDSVFSDCTLMSPTSTGSSSGT